MSRNYRKHIWPKGNIFPKDSKHRVLAVELAVETELVSARPLTPRSLAGDLQWPWQLSDSVAFKIARPAQIGF